MLSKRTQFIALNVLGGLAVLGSYAACIIGWPEQSEALWGAIPEAMIPFYTANMFVAATGYFLFSWRAFAVSETGVTRSLNHDHIAYADLIPQVVRSVVERRSGAEDVFSFPSSCPECGAEVVRGEDEVAVRSVQFLGGRSFPFLLSCYAATLIASALWMPLSLYAVVQGAEWMYWIIVADLGAVAGGSLGILVCMVTMSPQGGLRAKVASITGACMFCSQTVLLDFMVWPWFFSITSS
jgi:hypothetical protein